MFTVLQSVGWAADAKWAAVQSVGVDHGGSDVAVSQQFLNGADVMPPFQEMDSKGMAQAVGFGWLADLCCNHVPTDRFLHQARIQVMPALLAGFVVAPALVLGEHPLPCPLPVGMVVLPAQRSGQLHASVPAASLCVV